MEAKLIRSGKNVNGQQRYAIYVTSRLRDYLRAQAGREDLGGVIVDIKEIGVIGHEEPDMRRFKKKQNVEVPA